MLIRAFLQGNDLKAFLFHYSAISCFFRRSFTYKKLQFVEQFAHTMRYGAQILGIAFMVMSK